MKVLIKAIAGSHLFGTDTPSSDTDYKGVFIPSAEEILLGTYNDTENFTTGSDDSKNSKDDIDVEMYSLRKFLKMIERGDTAALELLFTPENMIVEKSPEWDEIKKHTPHFLSKSVTAMVGYARQQANKYGIKGSRMGELNNVISLLKDIEKTLDFSGPKLKHNWEKIIDAIKDYEHVHLITLTVSSGGKTLEIPALDILGKKFDYHTKFSTVLETLKRIYKNYGQRAREAKKNNGVDFKALSHAVRVCLQGVELLQTGNITLPLPPEIRDIVVKIKSGQIEYKDTAPIVEGSLEKLEEAKKKSTLQDKVNRVYLDKILVEYHMDHLMKCKEL